MTSDKNLSVWIVDDHQLFRVGFRTLLNRIKGVKVTFEADNGKAFIDQLKNEHPNIVFLDIAMPEVNGIAATQQAMRIFPKINIIVLSMFGDKEYYDKLVDLGIKGFLLKSCDFQEVVRAIEAVSTGDFYFSKELLDQLAIEAQNNKEETSFSDREREILVKICEGKSNQEIGDELFISKRTVEKHRANLMVKTGCSNTASLVVYAVKTSMYKV